MATKKVASKKSGKAAQPAKKAPAKPAKKAAGKAAAPKKAVKSAPAKPTPAKKAPAKAAKAAVPSKAKPAAKTVSKPVTKAAAKAKVAPKKQEIKKPVPAAAKKAVVPAKAAPAKTVASKAPVKAETPKAPVKKPEVAAPSHEKAKTATKPLENKPAPASPKEQPKPAKVVIPKTSTDKAIKYEPDFTRSILDNSQKHEENGPTMRYSDAELAEFRELINKKLEIAKKELAYLQGLITRKDESGDLDEGRYMTMEDGSMSMEREQLSQMASRQIQFIDHLEKAIMRIENKTYGICRVTGKLIDKARLRAVPHATLSIEAKQMMNK